MIAGGKRRKESPESEVVPYEGLSTTQVRMTGESLPDVIFEICDGCHWCSTCISERGVLGTCPACGRKTSRIKMAVDEVCVFEKDDRGGVTLRFDRKLPLR
jgi:hypothetical protein